MKFARHGSGPRSFFCLHGWAGTSGAFQPLLASLPPGVTLFAGNLPGCGGAPPPAGWSLDAIAGEVAGAIVESVRSGPDAAGGITMVGSCSGSLFALAAGEVL